MILIPGKRGALSCLCVMANVLLGCLAWMSCLDVLLGCLAWMYCLDVCQACHPATPARIPENRIPPKCLTQPHPPESHAIHSRQNVSRETCHNSTPYTPNNIAPTTLYAAFYGMENPGGGRIWASIDRGA